MKTALKFVILGYCRIPEGFRGCATLHKFHPERQKKEKKSSRQARSWSGCVNRSSCRQFLALGSLKPLSDRIAFSLRESGLVPTNRETCSPGRLRPSFRFGDVDGLSQKRPPARHCGPPVVRPPETPDSLPFSWPASQGTVKFLSNRLGRRNVWGRGLRFPSWRVLY